MTSADKTYRLYSQGYAPFVGAIVRTKGRLWRVVCVWYDEGCEMEHADMVAATPEEIAAHEVRTAQEESRRRAARERDERQAPDWF